MMRNKMGVAVLGIALCMATGCAGSLQGSAEEQAGKKSGAANSGTAGMTAPSASPEASVTGPAVLEAEGSAVSPRGTKEGNETVGAVAADKPDDEAGKAGGTDTAGGTDRKDRSETPVTGAAVAPKSAELFSIQAGGTQISLRDRETDKDLAAAFGEPVSREIRELSGDGFAGSRIKKVTYPGLEVELFSPPDPKQGYWIMAMTVTGRGFPAAGGIEPGSTVREVLAAYPGISLANDGRTDPSNAAYELYDELESNHLRLEVKDGVVTEIRIYHLIP